MVPIPGSQKDTDFIKNSNINMRVLMKGCTNTSSSSVGDCDQIALTKEFDMQFSTKNFICNICDDKDECNSVSSLQKSLMLTIVITLMTIFGF